MSKYDNNTEDNSNSFWGTLFKGAVAIGIGVTTFVLARQVNKYLEKPKDIIEITKATKPKVSFLILGSRKVGKTALIKWLQSMDKDNKLNWFELEEGYQPTLAQGADVPDMYIKFGSKEYNIAIPLDLAGEFDGPSNQWVKVYQDPNVKLNGLILMLDHNAGTPIELHKAAWEAANNLIKENPERIFQDNIKALYIVVNKSDLWRENVFANDIITEHYPEQFAITKRIADRLDWILKITDMSLAEDKNVKSVMSDFATDIQ